METQNNSETQQNEPRKDNKMIVPASIVLAGALVAGAVWYTGGTIPAANPGAGSAFLPGDTQGALVSGGEEILKARKDDYILGDPSAKVTLIEYGDFQCPFCERMFRDALPQIKEEYIKTGKARLIYRHFPLNSIHSEAQKSAEAAECAGEQGKFWEMHDILFGRQSQLGISNYRAWAQELGLNTAQFNECLDSGKYAQKVSGSFEEGRSVGVSGTPATFVNNVLVSGAQPFGAFKSAIEAALK